MLELRLSPWFPRAPKVRIVTSFSTLIHNKRSILLFDFVHTYISFSEKECKVQADAFFDCFTAKSTVAHRVRRIRSAFRLDLATVWGVLYV